MSVSPTLAAMLTSAIGPLLPFDTGLDVVQAIRNGLPVAAVDRLVDEGELTYAEVDRVVLPRKTLAHRKTIGTLTADQGDRLVRVTRVIAQAYDTFGNREKAQLWLRRQTSALSGESPLGLLDTEEGAREVEALLTRVAHGIAA